MSLAGCPARCGEERVPLNLGSRAAGFWCWVCVLEVGTRGELCAQGMRRGSPGCVLAELGSLPPLLSPVCPLRCVCALEFFLRLSEFSFPLCGQETDFNCLYFLLYFFFSPSNFAFSPLPPSLFPSRFLPFPSPPSLLPLSLRTADASGIARSRSQPCLPPQVSPRRLPAPIPTLSPLCPRSLCHLLGTATSCPRGAAFLLLLLLRVDISSLLSPEAFVSTRRPGMLAARGDFSTLRRDGAWDRCGVTRGAPDTANLVGGRGGGRRGGRGGC